MSEYTELSTTKEAAMRGALLKLFEEYRYAQELYPILNEKGYYLTKSEYLPDMIEKIMRITGQVKAVPGFGLQ